MRELKVGAKYKHFKGDTYEVIQKGIYADNFRAGQPNVGYVKVGGDGTIYTRDYDEFISKVDKKKYPDATQKYRFQEINPEHHNGLFITVEGGDRVGKSYAVDQAMKMLRGIFNIIRTREPGGKDNKLAEKIRELILDKDNSEMTKATEMYLYAASRAQHVEKTLKPLLENHNIVLCDRFIHSSVVYQTIDSNITAEQVYEYNRIATENGKYLPDHTFIFYLEDEEELERRFNNTDSVRDRIESRDIEFFKRVNRAYRDVEMAYPTRTKFHLIECSGNKEQVLAKFIKELIPILVDYTNKNNLLDFWAQYLFNNGIYENALGGGVSITPSSIKCNFEDESIKISWTFETEEMSNYPERKTSIDKVVLFNNEAATTITQFEMEQSEPITDENKSLITILSKVIM